MQVRGYIESSANVFSLSRESNAAALSRAAQKQWYLAPLGGENPNNRITHSMGIYICRWRHQVAGICHWRRCFSLYMFACSKGALWQHSFISVQVTHIHGKQISNPACKGENLLVTRDVYLSKQNEVAVLLKYVTVTAYIKFANTVSTQRDGSMKYQSSPPSYPRARCGEVIIKNQRQSILEEVASPYD